MIFQSRGPFVDDSRTMSIFISDSIKNKHDVFWFKGVATEISNYELAVPRNYEKKCKGLMVNYIQYGCCSLYGWDMYKTEFIFFKKPPNGMDKTETIRIININNEDY